MRRKTLVLLLLVVAGCFASGAYVATLTESPYNLIAFSAASCAALFIVYRFGVLPHRFATTFSTVAKEDGFTFRLIDGQPHLMGNRDGVDFAISVVTRPASNVYGFRSECVGTASIRENVPNGLRIHRRNDVSWYHVLSGKNEVVVEAMSEPLLIEGRDAEEVRAFCERNKSSIQRVLEQYKSFLLSGSDPLNVSTHVESESGVLTIVVPRSTDPATVRAWIVDLTELSVGFETGS